MADFGVMIATIAANVFVVWYERSRGKALGSAFLMADATHAGSDLGVTALALVSLIVTRTLRLRQNVVTKVTCTPTRPVYFPQVRNLASLL